MRTEYRTGRSQADPVAYAARVQLGREVADVLRKNVVQGVKVDRDDSASSGALHGGGQAQDEHGLWRKCQHNPRQKRGPQFNAFSFFRVGLRMTDHTELGSNNTIKSETSRSSRTIRERQPKSSTSTA